MRKIFDPQLTFGQVSIDQIKINLRCRDEVPKLLLGLQHIYCNQELRRKVFDVLKSMLPKEVDSKNGRPGMDLWKILVMGTIRLVCDWNFDKLQEIVNNHRTIRQMLGHGPMDDEKEYALQTLKDNIQLFTPEILDQINVLVVAEGHKLLGKKKDEKLMGRCDSFVTKTDIHFPTDINLLLDAIRKMIQLIAVVSQDCGLTLWRQSAYNINTFKRLHRKVQNLKRSTSKDEKKKAERQALVIEAHKTYIETAEMYVRKAMLTIKTISVDDIVSMARIQGVEMYIAHANRQIDQIRRRVILGESIPHGEKVFSIFEPHTEWISKGKAGILQELGLRVCILEDQFGLILHHKVMENVTDDKVTIPMIDEARLNFPELRGCSFDKGFYSPDNKKGLRSRLDLVVLPKKGNRNKTELAEETADLFLQSKKKHSAVESAIHGLVNHGLDRCLDHGLHGFKRYVSLSVLARNIQIIGHHIQQKELKRIQLLEQREAA